MLNHTSFASQTPETQAQQASSSMLSSVVSISSTLDYPSSLLLRRYHQLDHTFQHWAQRVFDQACHAFGPTQLSIDVLGGMTISLTVFWVLGLLYTVLDLTRKPSFLYRYKTQMDNVNNEVTASEVLKTAKVALLNQLTVQLATTLVYHYLMEWRGMDQSPKVPSLLTFLLHIGGIGLTQEVSFYYLHRLLHYGRLYRLIHKVHHYWQAPIAISAIYCHPLEHLLANLVPVLLGPLLFGSHRAILFLWLVMVHVVTLNDHSGYALPGMPNPEFHDYHHMKFNQNYGRMGFLDQWHGTSDRYLVWKAEQKQKKVKASLAQAADRQQSSIIPNKKSN